MYDAMTATPYDPISRSFAIVDHTLRETFPNNYWQRCMYAALGMRELLYADGISARIVFGDLACFTISPDFQTAGWDGYVNDGKSAAHFWLEADGLQLDLGPYYLPANSRRPLAAMPLVRWQLNEVRPPYLKYRELGRGDVDLQTDVDLAKRAVDFVDRCVTLHRSGSRILLGAATWQLTGTPSLMTEAHRGNTWARAALQLVMGRMPPPAPF